MPVRLSLNHLLLFVTISFSLSLSFILILFVCLSVCLSGWLDVYYVALFCADLQHTSVMFMNVVLFPPRRLLSSSVHSSFFEDDPRVVSLLLRNSAKYVDKVLSSQLESFIYFARGRLYSDPQYKSPNFVTQLASSYAFIVCDVNG